MTPFELQNLLWVAYNKPEWIGKTLEILEGREEYEEDVRRDPRDYQPINDGRE